MPVEQPARIGLDLARFEQLVQAPRRNQHRGRIGCGLIRVTVVKARQAAAVLQAPMADPDRGAAMIDRKAPRNIEQIGDAMHHAHLAVGIGHQPDLDQRHSRRIGHLQLGHKDSFVGFGPHNVVSANPAQARLVLNPSHRDGHLAP